MGDRDNEEWVDPAITYGAAPSVMPGQICQTEPGGRRARVMYVGQVPGMPAGYWIGVQYDDKVGKNDGSVNGRRYFRCPPGHGGFLRPPKVKAVGDASQPTSTTDESPKPGQDRRAVAKPTSSGRVADADAADYAPAAAADGEGSARGSGGLYGATSISSNKGPKQMARSGMTLAVWHKEIGAVRGTVGHATPDGCRATGTGLASAVVGALSQFTVVAYDSEGTRIEHGNDDIQARLCTFDAAAPIIVISVSSAWV